MTDTASAEATDPDLLLAGYRAGDFAFVTRQRTVLASGTDSELAGPDVRHIDEQLADAFAVASTPIAVGVLPFDRDGAAAARLVIPARFRSAGPAHEVLGTRPSRSIGAPVRMSAVPSEQQHIDAVVAALRPLRAGELRKVVLARALDVEFPAAVDPACLLHNLVAGNPDGFTFAAALPSGRTLVGSTPELLVRRRGRTVSAHPHAGTAPRSADPAQDARNAAALLASAKERTEHALVVDAVVEGLRPFCRRLTVPEEPTLTSTPAVWHLGTKITGELAGGASALRLAAALHPTPAVCGTPTEAARTLAGELEPFDRGYYAGAVGWVDAAGDGEWAVSIRCAEVAGRSMRLYAGGGIVAASDPQAELEETSAKFTTLLRAMGISAATAAR